VAVCLLLFVGSDANAAKIQGGYRDWPQLSAHWYLQCRSDGLEVKSSHFPQQVRPFADKRVRAYIGLDLYISC